MQLLGVWRGAYAVIDEVDMVFHPLRSELNWPLGDKYALDFAPHRWQLPMTLLEAMLAVQSNDPAAMCGIHHASREAEVLGRLVAAVAAGVASRAMQALPYP